MEKIKRQKKDFEHFLLQTFLLNFALSVCFLHHLIINMARKLEAAESNLVMENILALSLLVRVSFLLFFFHALSLADSLSLSFLIFFVDATPQLLLCGVRSSSITLTSHTFT